MKILILGSYYSDNLGDGVICECVQNRLSQSFPSAEFVIFDLWNRDCFQTRGLTDVKSLIARERRNGLRALASRTGLVDKQYKHEINMIEQERSHLEHICKQDCDLVVFAGGQMFMDSYAMKLHYIVSEFSKRHIPIIFNACGAGPNYSKAIRQCLSETLDSQWVHAISCRDDVRKINQCYTPNSQRTVPTFDPALWCGECYGIQREPESRTVGLGIMAPARSSVRTVHRFWVNLICELERRGITWKIFVNGSGSDHTFAHHVVESVPNLERSYEACSVQIPVTPRELVQTISQFKSIISFRLHSHIIATSLDIPSVAMVWDDKVRFFFEKIGHPERCYKLWHSPQKVLDKLALAEREGYDRTLIEEQKQYSEEWLINAVKSTELVWTEHKTPSKTLSLHSGDKS